MPMSDTSNHYFDARLGDPVPPKVYVLTAPTTWNIPLSVVNGDEHLGLDVLLNDVDEKCALRQKILFTWGLTNYCLQK